MQLLGVLEWQRACQTNSGPEIIDVIAFAGVCVAGGPTSNYESLDQWDKSEAESNPLISKHIHAERFIIINFEDGLPSFQELIELKKCT